eukprot:IDg19140t1
MRLRRSETLQCMTDTAMHDRHLGWAVHEARVAMSMMKKEEAQPMKGLQVITTTERKRWHANDERSIRWQASLKCAAGGNSIGAACIIVPSCGEYSCRRSFHPRPS